MRRLIEAVLEDHDQTWKDNTREQFVIDANAILEALLLQHGVEAALTALVEQGFSPTGQYRSVAEHLYRKARQRRATRQPDVG